MKLSKGFSIGVVFIFALPLHFAQSQAVEEPPASEVLQWSETKQVEFVRSAMVNLFPDKDGDRLGMLLVNRSALLIPILEARIEQELIDSSPSERFIEMASALMVYPGDEESLRAVARLVRLDDKRFSGLVDRTLDNALTFRNPFQTAYLGMGFGDVVSRQIGAWAAEAVHSPRMQRLWAETLLERYGRAPQDSDWETDELAVLLKPDDRLRKAIFDFAKEVRPRRN